MDLRPPARHPVGHAAHELRVRHVPRHRALAREHPVEQKPDLVDVRLLARVARRDDLGRHDGVVDDVRTDRGHPPQLRRDAEVADLDDGPVAAVRDEDVARVKVVVDDVVVVEKLHRREELARKLDDEPLLHRDAEHRRAARGRTSRARGRRGSPARTRRRCRRRSGGGAREAAAASRAHSACTSA